MQNRRQGHDREGWLHNISASNSQTDSPLTFIPTQDGENRKAEILSIATRKGKPTFYVHYEEFNKRLDEWVAPERIDLSHPVEWPVPEKPEPKSKQKQTSKTDSKQTKTGQKRPRTSTHQR